MEYLLHENDQYELFFLIKQGKSTTNLVKALMSKYQSNDLL